jgi:endonuclease YncB( thermonuclease family)
VRHVLVLLLLALTAAVLAASAQPAPEGAFTLRGRVSYVVDGDTLAVGLDNGRRERVRLIGIDTPERGACLAAKATGLARRLADDERIVLRGDATQDTRDRYGRLLAYAWVRGRDLGFRMVAAGLAHVYVYDRPFQRLGAYRNAEAMGRRHAPNVWAGCAAPVTPARPRSSCDASYPTVCIPPPPPDLDCADVPQSGFAVRGTDPHHFDGDGDGIGCE